MLAIDLLDEAASRLRLQQESKPELIENLDRAIILLEMEKQALSKESDPASQERRQRIQQELDLKRKELEELNKVWHEEKGVLNNLKEVKKRLDSARIQLAKYQREGQLALASELLYSTIPQLEKEVRVLGQKKMTLLSEAVTDRDVVSVVSRQTGIPLTSLMQSEKANLLNMESVLQQNIIGQDEAVRAISNAVRISRAGLSNPNRPMASFLFLGPTGVGKTELCKQLAQFLFHDPHAMVRIDMSEYMERFSVSRLLGAPPGYVGYEEGGVLTEAVRRRPYQIVLFDEFEKAHREVSNILLQILDEGFITDSHGKRVDFRNTSTLQCLVTLWEINFYI